MNKNASKHCVNCILICPFLDLFLYSKLTVLNRLKDVCVRIPIKKFLYISLTYESNKTIHFYIVSCLFMLNVNRNIKSCHLSNVEKGMVSPKNGEILCDYRCTYVPWKQMWRPATRETYTTAPWRKLKL